MIMIAAVIIIINEIQNNMKMIRLAFCQFESFSYLCNSFLLRTYVNGSYSDISHNIIRYKYMADILNAGISNAFIYNFKS